MSPKALLDFTNAEGNILLALSSNTPTPAAISSLLLEIDIHLPPEKSALVVDHFNYDITSATKNHDVLLVSRPKAPRFDMKNFLGGDGLLAVPRAVGQTLGNESPLLVPILRAPDTAYSYNPKDHAESVEDVFASGSQLSLISAMQARNSARFVVLGSTEMLENTWFDASVRPVGDAQQVKTANKEFAKQLTAWTFKEAGVLKVGRVEHYLTSDLAKMESNSSSHQLGFLNPKIYRIKNDVVCSVAYPSFCIYCPGTHERTDLQHRIIGIFRLALYPLHHLSF